MKAFHQMISMELSDDEKLDNSPWLLNKTDEERLAEKLSKPEFPFGLQITLTHNEFEKLGLDYDEAEVGAIFHGHFMARVTSVSCSENDSTGKCCRVEAQIEDLEIESEDEENEEEEDDEDRRY